MGRLALLAVAGLMALAGCGSAGGGREGGPRSSMRVQPVERRIDAFAGRTLVVPVEIAGAIDARRGPGVRLDDGRTLGARLEWIGVHHGGDDGGWLADPGVWSATPASAGVVPRTSGTWALVIDLPEDAHGRAVSVDGVRLPIVWRADPASLAPEGGGVPWEPWSSPVGVEAWSSARFQRLIEPEKRSPVRRWRWRLATVGLTAEPFGPAPADEGAATIEALARQMEARWQTALAVLWDADPAVADRMRRALTAVGDFGDGTLAPVWPEDAGVLDALLDDLLRPGLAPGERSARAERWLGALPAAVAWVIDDSGREMAVTREPAATIGVANLNDHATLGWLNVPGASAAPEPTPIGARSVARLTAPLPVREGGEGWAGSSPLAVWAHCGSWSARLGVGAGAVPALPPGLRCGPLLNDWTLASWSAAREDFGAAPSADALTVAMLYRDERGWMLYAECRTPGRGQGAGGAQDAIRVWLGPYGLPRAVLRISADGSFVDELSAWSAEGEPERLDVVRGEDRWSVAVPIPEGSIEPDGRVRLAIERFEPDGRRTAWPRRMLPWQAEPGRVVVEVGRW